MSRQDRLREYSKPTRGPQGAGRDEKNLEYWSNRATENSECNSRASDGSMHLPSTKVNTRDTTMSPKVSRGTDPRMVAKEDMNVAGDSPYLRGVRRGA